MSKRTEKAVEAIIENANKRMLKTLRLYLDFCKENGHKPEKKHPLAKKFMHLQSTFSRRFKLNMAIPTEILNLYTKTAEYKTKRSFIKNKTAEIKQTKLNKFENITKNDKNRIKFEMAEIKKDPKKLEVLSEIISDVNKSKSNNLNKRLNKIIDEIIKNYEKIKIETIEKDIKTKSL